jgi:acetyl esterase/lipase
MASPANVPAPDFEALDYGPHARHRLDLWLARTSPSPLVVAIHGGGWYKGDKQEVRGWGFVRDCLAAGISVAALNYRLTQHAIAPTPMRDCARAIQFLRYRASEWGLDPRRFGATGNSAGGVNSLWVAFHSDLADPQSDDPVARQSTRLDAVFTVNTPTFLDETSPINGRVPAAAFRHEALPPLAGVAPGEISRPESQQRLREVSPLSLAHPGAPPVFLLYGQRLAIPPDASPGAGIHHPTFGAVLKQRLDELGVACVFRCRDDDPTTDEEQFNQGWKAARVHFFVEMFRRIAKNGNR